MDIDAASRLKAQTEKEIAELLTYFANKSGLTLKDVDYTYQMNIAGEVFGLVVNIRAEL
jgi:hypothetical protein